MISVVIPAHNEARVIGRLLDALLRDARHGEFDVVVVANGCTDDTADVAERHAGGDPHVRVLTTPVASKREALRLGDAAARGFPRLYVDADVTLDTAAARALATRLTGPGAPLAAAPERRLALAGRPWTVRAYYEVWSRLPQVRNGLFARGAIGVNREGNDRIRALPLVMADDLAASLAFRDAERAILSGVWAVIHPPRTFADLLRRRIRAATGVGELERVAGAGAPSARTAPRDLVAVAAREPRLLPAVALFVAVAVLARFGARAPLRAGDFDTWLRDESSRTGP
ncbi:glycosyltransferase [Microtetraspora fusca]|uniref:glycosyltransferase n=1 Tax=Microtetraspora fusca TaxID=1997 RepID=UPI0008327EAE|nr:glycosyltransferase family 2 protein [Microtetraspora fusca]